VADFGRQTIIHYARAGFVYRRMPTSAYLSDKMRLFLTPPKQPAFPQPARSKQVTPVGIMPAWRGL
jgi:hypothetical protein